MLRVKKCANCGQNSFKLLYDLNPSIACESCGQVYNHTVFKRLPDDMEATRNIQISVKRDVTEVGNAKQLLIS
jgi:uncharacterized Zn finger protein